ncbi:unnamed protein product [Dovyalis caffra]|uniref:Secreted protein n=1 Tax=Dovyalis caffra TaxID=77055 RepID=A0AAV1QWD2_9ROSI|nr:unnamed protein product [Dovyalis caffra]
MLFQCFRAILVFVVRSGVEPLFGFVSDTILADASLYWPRGLIEFHHCRLLGYCHILVELIGLAFACGLDIIPCPFGFGSYVYCLTSVWARLGRLVESASSWPPHSLSHILSGLH